MATVKKGVLTPAPQWWKHLRAWKRIFWRRERKAARELLKHEVWKIDEERKRGC